MKSAIFRLAELMLNLLVCLHRALCSSGLCARFALYIGLFRSLDAAIRFAGLVLVLARICILVARAVEVS